MNAIETLPLPSLTAMLAMLLLANPASASVVYSNDFETDSAGFDVSHRNSFPSDAVGGVSTYLGSRSPVSTSAVLTLTGLTPGATYDLDFDLYVGGTWDGSGGGFGPDFFSVSSSSAGTLVNATFRNGFPIGDPTPVQSYSDATPLGDGGLFRTRAGSDVELAEPIYYFGHGPGNPVLSFTAAGTIEVITFSSHDPQFASDEFFALDNVVVSLVPEPSSATLAVMGIVAATACFASRRARRAVVLSGF